MIDIELKREEEERLAGTWLGCSQANVSGHLACLKKCDLVTDRPEGRAVYYRNAQDGVVELLRSAERLLAETGTAVELCANYTEEAKP